MPRPNRQGIDQDLAEKICGDDVELSGDLVFQDVAGRELDVVDMVDARIPLRCRAGDGVFVDCEHTPGPEITAGDRQNAAASPSIEHRPTRLQRARDPFEQAQAHRGRGVLARSEGSFGRNDKRARMVRLRGRRLFSPFPQNHKARTDAQWFDPGAPRKMLKPVSPQLLDAAAKLNHELA